MVETFDQIEKSLKVVAYEAVGIAVSTYYSWLKLSKAEEGTGRKCQDFADAVSLSRPLTSAFPFSLEAQWQHPSLYLSTCIVKERQEGLLDWEHARAIWSTYQ